MVPSLSSYIHACERARLFNDGRFASHGRFLRSVSLRGQHAWAEVMQHVDALTEMFRDAARRRSDAELAAAAKRAKETSPSFTKAIRGINTMYAAIPKRLKAVARPVFEEQKPRAAEVVAKCFDALAHNPRLNAAQRGELMLGLGRAANLFSKSHQQNLIKVERALALLRSARAAKIGADADKWIASLEENVRRGEVEPADLLAIETHLADIRDKLRKHLGKEPANG